MLDQTGLVEWFRFRFELVFLTPFRHLIASESPDCYIWICVMELAGAALTALADFADRGQDSHKFVSFVENYLPTFADATFVLYDPTPDRRTGPAQTPAQQLHKFFRNGLAHDFCIGWGGIQHREEIGGVGHGYLFQTTQGLHGEHGLGIVPREFVRDFQEGCERYLTALATARPDSEIRRAFARTFERVYLTKTAPPLP